MKFSKQILLSAALFIIILLFSSCSNEIDVEKLHEECLVWDCHNDLAKRVLCEGLDIGNRLPGGHVDIPRLQEGKVDVQVVALYVDNFLYPGHAADQAFAMIDVMKESIRKNSNAVELARSGSDIERITGEGKIAMPLAIEGGHALEDDIHKLKTFRALGISSMTLTHNVHHGWADSSKGKPRWNGLNELGKDVIREMNRLGIVIDVSHVSDETFFDVLDVTEDPVIFSHSGCRTLNEHRRNVSDDMLRALSENGGVIGIVFELTFISPSYKKRADELRAISRPFFRKVPTIENLELRVTIQHLSQGRDWPLEGKPGIDVLLDHIDHAVKTAGIDHVGLGADMYPRTPSPVGIRGVHDYSKITRGLKQRGYSDKDVGKIMGENFRRVWKKVTERKSDILDLK